MIVRYRGNFGSHRKSTFIATNHRCRKARGLTQPAGVARCVVCTANVEVGAPRRLRQIVTRAFPMTDGRYGYGDVHAAVRSLHFHVDTAGYGPVVLGRHRPRRRRRSRRRGDQSEEGRREDRRDCSCAKRKAWLKSAGPLRIRGSFARNLGRREGRGSQCRGPAEQDSRLAPVIG